MAPIHKPTVEAVESFSELSTFQDEVLLAIAKLEAAGNEAYGLAIKRELETVYDAEVNHGRLYPNLDELVDGGLVEKTELDKRTNEYTLTAAGEQYLVDQRDRLVSILEEYLD